MAKQVVTRAVIKTRIKKNGEPNSAGFAICKNCGGDGVVRRRKKTK